MSLYHMWVKAVDGKWYENPTIYGKILDDDEPEYDWFVCWDDDDPVELVMREEVDPQKVYAVIGNWFKPTCKLSGGSARSFENTQKTREFYPAKSQFGNVNKRIPVPNRYASVSKTEGLPSRAVGWYGDPEKERE